jgi:chromatin remodeling complex protein RSC6
LAVRKPHGKADVANFDVGAPLPEHTSEFVKLGPKPLTPSPQLAEIVGSGELSRGEVVSKLWDYIKKNKLQDPANKRAIVADMKLKPVFGGKDKVSMFEMNKYLIQHLK